jgi:hypothetical protein
VLKLIIMGVILLLTIIILSYIHESKLRKHVMDMGKRSHFDLLLRKRNNGKYEVMLDKKDVVSGHISIGYLMELLSTHKVIIVSNDYKKAITSGVSHGDR